MFVKKGKTELDGDIQELAWEPVMPAGYSKRYLRGPLCRLGNGLRSWVKALVIVVFLLLAVVYLTIAGAALATGVELMGVGEYHRGFFYMVPFLGGLYLGWVMLNDLNGKRETA